MISEKQKEYQKDYQKQYRQSLNGKISKKKYNKKYRKSDKGKLIHRKSIKKFWLNNPEKRNAINFINNLLQSSNFSRDNCSICGKPNAEFHHENYDLPYFGYWFCKIHHSEIHKEKHQNAKM